MAAPPPFTNSGSDCTTCRIYSLASQHSVCPCRLLRVIYSGVTSSFRLHLLPASPPAESRASCARDPRNLGTSHPNKPHIHCTERGGNGDTVACWPAVNVFYGPLTQGLARSAEPKPGWRTTTQRARFGHCRARRSTARHGICNTAAAWCHRWAARVGFSRRGFRGFFGEWSSYVVINQR